MDEAGFKSAALEHAVFYRNRDSRISGFLIQDPCWRTGASMDDATLFRGFERAGVGEGRCGRECALDCGGSADQPLLHSKMEEAEAGDRQPVAGQDRRL